MSLTGFAVRQSNWDPLLGRAGRRFPRGPQRPFLTHPSESLIHRLLQVVVADAPPVARWTVTTSQ